MDKALDLGDLTSSVDLDAVLAPLLECFHQANPRARKLLDRLPAGDYIYADGRKMSVTEPCNQTRDRSLLKFFFKI